MTRAPQKIIPLIISKKEYNIRTIISKGLGRFLISLEKTIT